MKKLRSFSTVLLVAGVVEMIDGCNSDVRGAGVKLYTAGEKVVSFLSGLSIVRTVVFSMVYGYDSDDGVAVSTIHNEFIGVFFWDDCGDWGSTI